MIELTATALGKSFGHRQVVKDVSINVKQGEIVGLLGPNGAGKTTSFYMIAGLIKCDKGQIFYGEQNITHLPIHARAHLGINYLPQEASVFRKLTVKENILGILELQSNLTAQQREQRLEQLLTEFNLQNVANQLGQSLSGGERRRVEIARALATEPQIILLDEPFAGVDPISIKEIKLIIEYLAKKNIGILITDHNVRETLDICKRAYIVNAGEIICAGPPSTILSNEQVRKVYLGDEFAV